MSVPIRRSVPLVFAAIIVLAVPVGAQQASEPPAAPSAALRARDPLAAVGLTAPQRAQIAALSTTFRQQQQVIFERRQAGVPMLASDQAALWQLGETHNAAVRAVLTPAQLTTLDAWLKERRAARLTEARTRITAANAGRPRPPQGAGSPIVSPNALPTTTTPTRVP